MTSKPIMTLSKMRASGVSTVQKVCPQCGCRAIIQVDGLPGGLRVAELGKGLCCISCGAPETNTQPNWREAEARVAAH